MKDLQICDTNTYGKQRFVGKSSVLVQLSSGQHYIVVGYSPETGNFKVLRCSDETGKEFNSNLDYIADYLMDSDYKIEGTKTWRKGEQ